MDDSEWIAVAKEVGHCRPGQPGDNGEINKIFQITTHQSQRKAGAERRSYQQAVAAAVLLCEDCPVKIPCRDSATNNREHGVWGGTTYEQRRVTRRGML